MAVNIGDVVLVDYLDFDNEMTTGLFLVYSVDNYWLSTLKSFSAIKICSKPQSFQVKLDQKQFKFLDHTSYANCICQHKFREDQIKSTLGVVNTFILNCIKKQLTNMNKDIDEQLDTTINHYNRVARAINTKYVTMGE